MSDLYEFLDLSIAFWGLIAVIVLGALNVWILIKLNEQSIKTTRIVNESNEKFTKELHKQNIENQKNLFEQNKNIMLYDQRKKTLDIIYEIYSSKMPMQNILRAMKEYKDWDPKDINEQLRVSHVEFGAELEKEDELIYRIKSDSDLLFNESISTFVENIYKLNMEKCVFYHENSAKILSTYIESDIEINQANIDETIRKLKFQYPEASELLVKERDVKKELLELEIKLKEFIIGSMN